MVELIAWQAYVRNQKIKKENMNLQFYLQLFTITKMKVKCKVTNQFTDEIFNLAKPVHWLCWGLTTRQPLWVILCRLPEKGRKVIEEIVEEIKERDREERNRNESEETEEIKIFPIYPYLLQG